MYGLDEIYEGLLLEAKSVEEIKKILEYQFVKGKGVPQEVLDSIFELDPTKKKTYTKWVLMQWENYEKSILSALENGKLKEMFSYFQERANTGLNLVSMKSFDDAINMLPNNDPIFGVKDDDEKANDFEIVYDSPEWRIAVPHTYEADVKLGRGCKWCTAGAFGDTTRYFDSYTSDGPLWVNFDKRHSEIAPLDKKEYPYTRYQFCFEASYRGELCDSNDDRINFQTIDIPEDVLKFYESKDESYRWKLEESENEESAIAHYEELRMAAAIFRKEGSNGSDLYMLPSYDDNYNPDFDDVDYEIYQSRDLRDSIDGCYYKVNDIVDKCDGFPAVIMYQYEYRRNVAYYENTYKRYDDTIEGIWSDEMIKSYDKDESLLYFINDYNNTFTFMFGPTINDIKRIEISKDAEIEETHFIKLAGVPEKYNGKFILITYDDDFYGLLHANLATKEIEFIIKKDKPENGEQFRVVKTENGIYIPGLIKDYWLFGDNKTNEIEYEERIDDNENLYIISYPDATMPTGKGYGIYNSQEKKVILKGAMGMNYNGFSVIGKFHQGYKMFDSETLRPITDFFVNGHYVDGSRVLFKFNLVGDLDKVYYVDQIEGFNHGPFNDVIKAVSNGLYGLGATKTIIIVSEYGSKKIKFYNPETKETIGLENIETINSINRFNIKGLADVTLNDGRSYYYDIFNNKIIAEHAPNGNLENFVDRDENIVKYKDIYDKYNIFTMKNGVILPQGVERIEEYGGVGGTLLRIQNDGKVYFLRPSKNTYVLLPSTKGININNIASMAFTKRINNLPDINFTVTTELGRYFVEYNPLSNEIISIKNGNSYDEKTNVSSQEIKAVNNLFFPNKQEISEQFKNIFNKIIDL